MQGLMMGAPLTITMLMEFATKVHPASEIVSVTCDNPRHRYTLKDAFKRVGKLANALERLGAKPEDKIGTLAWNDYRHYELYFAVSCSGMVCHTINPRLFAEQIEYIVNHAEDQFLFIDLLFVPLLEQLQGKISNVKGIIVLTDKAHMPETSLENVHCYETLLDAESEQFSWPELDENEACALCYTSGTTGHPKGVLYSHRSTVLHAYASCLPDVFALGKNDVVLPVVPMFHVNAWGIPYSTALTGAKLVYPGPKMADGEVLTSLINDEKVTLSAGVPTIWLALLKYLNDSGKTIPSLKEVVVGGAACPLSVMEDFDKYDVYTHAAWGMTETSPLGTFNTTLDRQALGEEEYARLRLKAGRSIFGTEIKIVDDKNQELPWDGVAFGALKIRGPWVCGDYYKLDGSDAHGDDGWFDTGDVATIDENGYMQITDRSKDVIKSGGEWISSIDLENAAVGHASVAEAAVIGVYHEKWTERPLLIIVKNPDCDVSREDMLAHLDGKVAKWWIPDDCVFVDSLPHTATGKLSKKDLRDQFKDYRFSE
jgi:3-(methylthio)propionyl---CoA ligase